MKKPEAWTAYDQGDPVYVYDVSEADEYSNALEAALREAVGLMKLMCDDQSIEHDRNRARSMMRAFLDKHGGDQE